MAADSTATCFVVGSGHLTPERLDALPGCIEDVRKCKSSRGATPYPRRWRSSGRSTLTMEQSDLLQRLSRIAEPNPALFEHARERAESVQNRIADRITAFAGSMRFVYLHIIWFGCWIGFGVEGYPYGLLTMIVSLEAIFLSTFVMISQNRADAKRQVIADQQWQTVKEEDTQNQELLKLSNQILELTRAIHAQTK
jgi:uncharacterized membrane protein